MNRNAEDQPESRRPSAASRWGRYLAGYALAIGLWWLGSALDNYYIRLFGAIIGMGTLVFGSMRVFGRR
ncbi:MAG: hypothetical protein V1794_17195 [Candidatus Glassbacteria bacterium]